MLKTVTALNKHEADFIFHEDAGHGWLAVKISLLKKLNLMGKITSYSYQKGGTAYLEEDCDMGTFLDAYESEHPAQIKIFRSYHERSPVRNYENFFPSNIQ